MACASNGVNSGLAAADSPQLNRRKLFERFREAFRKDFEFVDVRDDLINNLLTEDECRQIMEESDTDKQLERLFFLLTYNEKKSIAKFVELISPSYYWLSTEIQSYLQYPRDDGLEMFETCIDRSWIPNKRNVLVHRCELLWEVIQNLKTLPRHHYLIIRGKMGFGKSWLAIDACMDYAVIRSTDFQLFWLNVSKCDTPDGILRQMQTLKIMMRSTNDHTEPYIGPEYDNIQLRIIELKKYFQNTFSSDKYQNSLLVLCEVQNKEVIDAFDFHCKILATGRSESCFDEIPKSRKRFVVIDRGLTEQESLDFFDKLNVFDPQTKYRMKVREIHRLCQGEPMIISLISNNITQFSGRKPETRLANYIKQLRQNQLTDSQMESTLEESLSVLPEDDRQAYQRMVVFPKNIYVPISVLARYWQMNQEDTEALVDRLYRFSLLSVDYRTDSNRPAEESTIYVSMHYIYSSYLRKLYDDDEFKEMHLDICKSYETDAVLQRRTEPELFDLPDDGYIHYYIGYHLQRSGQRHLFPNFYFDFGFLEQKLRYTGLPNTRGDLEEYRSDIVRDDESKRELWNELLDFLPTIEEMVHQNNDTSLLQYALNASDTIAEEAVRQAMQFQNRVWFDDVGHPAKQRRQMVKLQRRPLVLKFYGPEAVIAALDDNSILLTDLSPSYVAEPTMLKEHTDPVHKLETFGNHYLISLDEGGTLLVWSLKDTPIYLAKCTDASMSTRSMDSSPGAQEDHMLKMRQFDVRNMNYRHTVDRIVETANLITCFKVHEAEVANVNGGDAFGLRNGFRNGGAVPQNKIRLFCGTQTGIVSCYEWCHKEEKFMSSGRIKTKLTDIRVLHFMAPVCLMVISAIHYQFMDMMNTAEMVLTSQWTDYPHPLAIYESSQLNGGGERKPAPGARIIYCVYRERIIRIDIQMIAGSCIHAPSMQEVYKAKASAAISCSTQSEDGKYLVLGTEKGIVVFDCGSNTEWQRNSNGYRIACIDMCTCDDFNYRYLMISGTENGVQEVLNIYGLPGRKNVVGRTMSNDRSAYYGHSAKLIGDNQFEVIQSPDRELMIYAVETGNIVHMLTSADGCVEGHATIEGPWKKITCTGQWAGMFCFGTNDGKFFLCLPRPDQGLPEYKLCSDMRDAIVYIKPIDPAFCIVATDTEYIVHSWKNANDSIQQTGKIVDCFAVDDNGRMIIVREHAPVQLIEMAVEPIEARVKYLAETSGNVPIVGCEYQGETLALLDVQGKIRFFTVDKERLPEEFELVPRSKVLIQYRISAIALSKDATILAVGSEKGDIYIYRMSDMQQLQILSSHKQPIKQLVFSPWPVDGHDVNNPMVLVSLSEQMCFWNIKYVINNPLDAVKKKSTRRSSRFSKELKWNFNGGDQSNGNDNELRVNGNGNGKAIITGPLLNHIDYWDDKTGASDKPELLACIKFVGSCATKLVTNAEFNKFITIDNEGDIYALKTTRPAHNNSVVSTTTPERLSAVVTKRFGKISLVASHNTLTISS